LIVDIRRNRTARKWTTCELIKRFAWSLVSPLFHLSPRLLWAWRRQLLRCFGATVGSHVHIYPSVKIAIPWNLELGDFSSIGDSAIVYNLGRITIGRAATVSQRVHLCAGTHNYTSKEFSLIKATIDVGEGAWVCADAFVGPNVEVGAFSIVGARSAVFKAVPPWTIVGGNPATIIKPRPRCD
jgi:putative colanic acid biosynthesis acetyltransferase WcaF